MNYTNLLKLLVFFFSTFSLGNKNLKSQIIKSELFDTKIKVSESKLKDSSKRTSIDYDVTMERVEKDVLSYFAEKAHHVFYFNYIFKNQKRSFHSDSIITGLKGLIDIFSERYNTFPPNDEKDITVGKFTTINNAIKNAYQKTHKRESEDEFMKIDDLIRDLNPSIQCIKLKLKFGKFVEHLSFYYNNISSTIESASFTAKQLKDGYQKAEAYKLIGDFAAGYKYDNEAIDMYFLARESIENYKTNSKLKLYESGRICESISNVFNIYSNVHSMLKCYEYIKKACDYYYNSGNIVDYNQCEMYKNSIDASLRTDLEISYNTEELVENRKNGLKGLKTWYEKLEEGVQFDFLTNYWGYFSIAKNLCKFGHYNEALIYYINALNSSLISGNNKAHISNTLCNIAYVYSWIGKKDLAISYVDLNMYLQHKTKDSLEYPIVLSQKAKTYLFLNNLDSSLYYLNKVINDTAFPEKYNQPQYKDLIKNLYEDKSTVLTATNADSADLYQNYSLQLQKEDLKDIADKLETESFAASRWLRNLKDYQNNLDLKLNHIRKINLSIESEIQNEKLMTGYLRHSADSLADIRGSDSLKYLDEISKANIETKNQFHKTEAQIIQNENLKKISEQQEKIIRQNKYLYWSIAIGLILAGSTLVFYQRNRSIKHSTEFNRVNELAKNKIHNIGNDYSEIGNLLKQKEFEKLEMYNSKYESFLAKFLENWKNDKITLKDELIAFKRYFATKEVLQPNLKLIFDEGVLENVYFVQSVFDTLLDNSIKRGFKGKTDDCLFTVSISRSSGYIFCEITDNGTPSRREEYLKTSQSGLNILKKRVANFYIEKGKKIYPNYFIATPLPNNAGSITKIVLPYEKV